MARGAASEMSGRARRKPGCAWCAYFKYSTRSRVCVGRLIDAQMVHKNAARGPEGEAK